MIDGVRAHHIADRATARSGPLKLTGATFGRPLDVRSLGGRPHASPNDHRLCPVRHRVPRLAPAISAVKPPSTSSTGSGTVFFPNPVAQLQNQSLTDQKDADYAALQPAYHQVTLTNLDGSGYLVGDWANIRAETGTPAYSATNTFLYHRNDDRFEQVMAYYWVTEAQKYIQSLGFGSARRPVNKESQDIRTGQFGIDNSFFWDKHDLLRFGKGGVDDAEDAEVILHEYGHAIQDSQVAGFGDGAGGRRDRRGLRRLLGGDGLESSSRRRPTPRASPTGTRCRTRPTPHCLRRVDTNAHYPEDLGDEVHANGLIWSRALWDIRNALGHIVADTIILEAQFEFAPDTTMPAAANATVAAAQSLYGTCGGERP